MALPIIDNGDLDSVATQKINALITSINDMTSTTTTTTTSGALGVAVSVKMDTSSSTVCTDPPTVTRYTINGTIATGLILYTDAAMTTPQGVFTFVRDISQPNYFNMNGGATGEIGTSAGSC